MRSSGKWPSSLILQNLILPHLVLALMVSASCSKLEASQASPTAPLRGGPTGEPTGEPTAIVPEPTVPPTVRPAETVAPPVEPEEGYGYVGLPPEEVRQLRFQCLREGTSGFCLPLPFRPAAIHEVSIWCLQLEGTVVDQLTGKVSSIVSLYQCVGKEADIEVAKRSIGAPGGGQPVGLQVVEVKALAIEAGEDYVFGSVIDGAEVRVRRVYLPDYDVGILYCSAADMGGTSVKGVSLTLYVYIWDLSVANTSLSTEGAIYVHAPVGSGKQEVWFERADYGFPLFAGSAGEVTMVVSAYPLGPGGEGLASYRDITAANDLLRDAEGRIVYVVPSSP